MHAGWFIISLHYTSISCCFDLAELGLCALSCDICNFMPSYLAFLFPEKSLKLRGKVACNHVEFI